MAFELPKLNYAFDALEPNIDAKTMEMKIKILKKYLNL
jgi:Fe-Mn family superoxide dismutase